MAEHEEYAANQLTAKNSWMKAFDQIFYLNHPEDIMDGPNIRFIPWEPFPTIKAIAELASGMDDLVAVVNSDIVIDGPRFRRVESVMKAHGSKGGMSRRYTFAPGSPLESAQLTDVGLDIFIATPKLWGGVSAAVPDEYRIGHNRWDTFMLGFLNYHLPGKLVDFTPARVIFHPIHSGRRQPFAISDKPIPYSGMTGIPRPRIR